MPPVDHMLGDSMTIHEHTLYLVVALVVALVVGGKKKHYLHNWVNKQLLQAILNYMQASQAVYIECNTECVTLL